MSDRIFGVEELRQRLTRPPTHQQEARQTIARIQGMPLNELVAAIGTLDPRTLPRGYREALEARLRPEYVERATTPQVPGAEGNPRALTNAPVGAAMGAQFGQLGQNLTRWEPTQAPMPEGDAPRLPPMVSPTTPDFDSRNALLAADEAARLSGLPQPPPARPRPPVVTPANATPGPQMPGGAPTGAAADPAQQVQAAAQQAAAQGNNTLADRLMAFGFAMAASRNPSLFGQIGEAGQQALQQRRQESQDDLQRRQVEGQLSYQEARVRLMQAEMDWARDPTNPQNIQRLAAARSAMASAGQGRRPNWQPIERVGPDGQIQTVYFDPDSGRTVDAPGARAGTAAQTARQQGDLLARHAAARRDVERLYQPDMLGMPLPPERQRERAARLAEIDQAFEMQGLRIPREQATERRLPTGQVIDLMGRPIQQ